MFGRIHWSGAFCFERILIVDSILLIDLGLFKLQISSVSLSDWIFKKFNLGYQYLQNILQYSFIIFLMYIRSPVMFSLSFLILVIRVLSLFLFSFQRQINFTDLFAKKPLLISLLFSIDFLLNFFECCSRSYSFFFSAYFGFHLLSCFLEVKMQNIDLELLLF